MNSNHAAEKSYLLEQLAENLIYFGFSISFKKLYGIEIIFSTSEAVSAPGVYFLPFDPVTTNAGNFLKLLTEMANFPFATEVVVAGIGEQQIIENIMKRQEIQGIEVSRMEQLKNYPLRLV